METTLLIKTHTAVPEASVALGQDPRRQAKLMSAVYDAFMSGGRLPARPRPIIWASWQRLAGTGLPTDQVDPTVAATETLEQLRETSDLRLVREEVTRALGPVTAAGDTIMVLTDADARVLWRTGSTTVLRNADALGFIDGALWAESVVGTNAIGTSLVSRRPMQTFYAEHFVRRQHPWTCSSAPISDPRTGRVIGIVDITGPASTVHPTTVALVATVARLAEARLWEHHESSLNRLRAIASPIVARTDSPSVAIDANGWVAAVGSMPMTRRLELPDAPSPGRTWLPGLGTCVMEPLPGGWLVRVVEGDSLTSSSRVILDLEDPSRPSVRVIGPAGTWTRALSPLSGAVLRTLAEYPGGCTASEIAQRLYSDPNKVGAVRVAMNRLRKQLTGIIDSRPYRFVDYVDVCVLHA